MAEAELKAWEVGDVAKHLKLSKSMVYHLARARKIPHKRIGRIIRFDPAQIRAWLQGNGR